MTVTQQLKVNASEMPLLTHPQFGLCVHIELSLTYCMPERTLANSGERGGSVVERDTMEREVGGSKTTSALLCT